MGRFKYIPQEFTDKAMIESEPIDINISKDSKANITDTMVVYDDYKIPLDITKKLIDLTLDTREKINNLYETVEEIYKNVDNAIDNYNSFEDKVFGKYQFMHDYGVFDYIDQKYSCKPIKYVESESSAYSDYISELISKLDYIYSVHTYNKHFLELQTNRVSNYVANIDCYFKNNESYKFDDNVFYDKLLFIKEEYKTIKSSFTQEEKDRWNDMYEIASDEDDKFLKIRKSLDDMYRKNLVESITVNGRKVFY